MIAFCVRHRRLVVLLWLLLAAALVAVAAARPGPSSDDFALPDSESQRAAALLAGHPADPPGTLVVSAPAGVDTPAVRQALRAIPGAGAFREVSRDGTVGMIPLEYSDAAAVKAARDAFKAPGITVELAGEDFADTTPGGATEGIGLLAAALVLLLTFRSVISSVLPLLIGVAGVTSGIALLTLLSNVVDTPGFAIYLTIMLGLGVGIDYALLIVTRFRASLRDGLVVEEAVGTAMRTAGRSVLFAGITVIVTGAGILFLGPSLGGGIALAAGCGVLMVMLAALTLLPALLTMAGARIGQSVARRRTTARTSFAYRWSRVVQRRPWLTGAAALAVLAVLALPALDLRVGWSDASNRTVSDTTRRAHDLLARAFGPGSEAPLALVSDSGAPIEAAVRQAAAFGRVFPVDARSAVLVPATGPQDPATERLIERLRSELPPHVLVAGSTAAAIDYAEFSRQRLPWTVGAVLLASFVIFLGAFRSVVLPLKAIAVNLLSIGSAYGVIVAIFQWDVFGRGTGGPVDAWVPMMLFVITFGLTMDYEVFLLSRIREERLAGRDNSSAVATGLARTAVVITAAATIMFCVFAAFGTFDDRALQIMGVGLAAAVLVDATVVRLILVPAVMEVLGERNWWFPRLTRSRIVP